MSNQNSDLSLPRNIGRPDSAALPPNPAWLNVVQENVHQIRFGVVQIIIHDAKVVQIERTEKTRLDVARVH